MVSIPPSTWKVGEHRTNSRNPRASFCAVTFGCLLLSIQPAVAGELPVGGQIVAGRGAINVNNDTLTIHQNSQNLAIDWQSFSIGTSNIVQFVQPGATASALNRVTGNQVSEIRGILNANGRLFLVNPNGVMFSSTAKVDVGALVASTLNISNHDFMAGNYTFTGTGNNAVINNGNITATEGGSVALIAAKIINSGNITTPQGSTLMGAGTTVTLDLGGPVNIEVKKALLDTYIEQSGTITADGGLVYLTAKATGDLVSSVINHSGVTEAQTLASGEQGRIMLMGDMSHGGVLVAGTLDAGAPSSGDGGFVETSAAHVKIADDVNITTYANNGKTGGWLIDPVAITIAASGGDVTGATIANALAGSDVTIDSTGSGSCTGVACSTLSSGTASTDGNIILDDVIDVTTGNTDTTLTFKAYHSIKLTSTASISSSSGKLNTIFWARAGADNAATDARVGSVWVPAGATINTNGGNIVMGGGTDPLIGYAYGDNRATSGENNAVFRGVTINGDINAEGGDIVISGKGLPQACCSRGVSIAGSVTTAGNGNISIAGIAYGSSDAVGLGDSSVASPAGSIHADLGNIYITGTETSSPSSDAIVLSSNSSIQTSGTLVLDGNGGTILATGGDYLQADNLLLLNADAATLTSTTNAVTTIGASSVGNLQYVDSDGLTIGTISWNSSSYNGLSASGSIDVATEQNDLTIDGNISTSSSSSGAITLNAGRSFSAGTGSGGDIVYQMGTIATGSGGRSVLYTGSLSGSSGLVGLVPSGSGHFRYNSDEVSTGYASALGSGIYAIFREQPTIAVSAGAQSITYGDALPAYTANYNGFVNGDTSAILFGTATWSTAVGTVSASGSRNVGSYDVTYASGLSNGLGYAISDNSAVTGELAISQRTLSLTLSGTTSRTYDGTNAIGFSGYTVAPTGKVSGDDLSVDTGSLTGFIDKNVGANKEVTFTGFALSGADSANYALVSGSAVTNASITPKAIDAVTGLSADDKTYDGTVAASLNTGSAGFTGIVSGDSLRLAGAIGVFSDKNAGIGKTVSVSGITLGGADVGNYTLTDTSAVTTASITPKAIDAVTGLSADDKTYDGTVAASLNTGSAGFTGIVSGDSLSLAGAIGVFSDKNAGIGKTVSVSGITLGGADVGNYTLTDTSATTTASIIRRSIAVVADAQSKIQGDVDPPLTFNVSCGNLLENCGLVTGDVLAGRLSRQSGDAPGNYLIEQGTLLEAVNLNYSIGFSGATFVIRPSYSLDTAIETVQQQLSAAISMPGHVYGESITTASPDNFKIVNVDGKDWGSVVAERGQQREGGLLQLFVVDGGIRLFTDRQNDPDQ